VSAGTFRRALVIRGGALGDFLLTSPTMAALRGAAQHLEILAYPAFADLACRTGLADAGRSIEYGPLAGFFARGAVQQPALREYFASFDLVLSYLYDPDGIFAENVRAAGAERFVQGPHRPAGKIHAVDELAEPLRELRVPFAERAVSLILDPHREATTEVAIHPGSGSAAKNWAADRWLGLAQEILSWETRPRLAVIGGEADQAALAVLAPLRSHERVVWWENLPLTELAARLSAAKAYIGHDTGVSHLAACLGVPSLLLFGPTDPAVWAPPHPAVTVLPAPRNDLRLLEPGAVASAARHKFPAPLLATPRGNTKNQTV